MTRAPESRSHKTKRRVTVAPRRERDPVAIILGLAVAGALLLVDVRAHAAFDAPKRLMAIFGIAIAACVAASIRMNVAPVLTRTRRIALIAGAAAIVAMVVSAAVSPHRAVALDGTRTMLLFALVVFLAARHDRSWRAVSVGFVAASAINAAIALLQRAGAIDLFQYATVGGRTNTSAMMGNDGLLSLTLAFAVIIAAGWMFDGRRKSLIAALLVLLLAAMLVNRSITAIVSLVAGLATFALLRSVSRPKIVVGTMLIATMLAGLAQIGAVHLARWNPQLTFRVGAWAAAAEMIVERPFTGFGAGTYGAEFAEHRIRADLRAGENLANPALTGSYTEAHSEYLQGMAELGVPALLLICVAIVASAMNAAAGTDRTSHVVVAVLIAGAVAALTWFPMQRPATCILLLASIGRAWRSE